VNDKFSQYGNKQMTDIFKAYDIRGAYPDELDEAKAKRIGFAFIRLLRAHRVVIGYDMRLSSQSLSRGFIEGVRCAGASVIDVGMTTTPMLYFAIIDGKYDGGVMVTASHLPGGMNGFKLCRSEAVPLSGDRGLPALENLVNKIKAEQLNKTGHGKYQKSTVIDQYIYRLCSFVHRPAPLKIVVDAGNGMAGKEIFALFRKNPAWKLLPMYMEPNGRFPHHIANPLLADTTRDLQAKVVEEKADVGVAFDGDADRCGFIDEHGDRIPEDLITALIAEFYLAKEPGATILYDLRSSRIVPETIARLGGKAIETRVGHAFIKAAMREKNALFAGELSGHYYYRDMVFTDNGIFTMIQMLNLLSLKTTPLSGLVEPLKKYPSTGEINMQVQYPNDVFTGLEAAYQNAKKKHLDGLTVECDNWWFNVRLSNTEPVMRLILEADDADTLTIKKEQVIGEIRKLDPGMIIKN
jgi:phosphomannomutase